MTQFDDKTVYILDSYGLIYRCYFAFISHPLTNSKGENVSALFGFFRNLHSILQHYKPSYIAAAMDSKTPTFRHKMFDQYKANRPKTPEDLHAQIPWICDVLSAMGIPTLQCDGYEADDIIATVASQCEKAGRPCRILSGDKDLMQLVTDSTQILKPDHNDVWKVIGPEGVKAEWGVNPDKMLDLLSLFGDTADNVPGVKGCGVKTACKFLEQYGSLDGIYEHADEIKGAIGQKIRDGKTDAYFSRDLIKLFNEVPCQDIDINKFVPLTLDYKKAADQLSKYQIPSCAKLYAELSLSSGGASSESDASQSSGDAQLSSLQSPGTKSEFSKKDLQEEKDNTEELKQKLIPLHKTEGKYRTISSSAELKKLTDEFLKNKKPVAIAVETLDKADYSSHLEGISLSAEKQTAFYIPFSDSQDLFSASGIEIKDAVEQIERLIDDSSITLIFHDMKYIYKVLRHNGLKSISVSQTKDLKRFADTMIAYWLLSPEETGNEPYSLLNTAQKKIAVLKTDYDEIMEKVRLLKTLQKKIHAAL